MKIKRLLLFFLMVIITFTACDSDTAENPEKKELLEEIKQVYAEPTNITFIVPNWRESENTVRVHDG